MRTAGQAVLETNPAKSKHQSGFNLVGIDTSEEEWVASRPKRASPCDVYEGSKDLTFDV